MYFVRIQPLILGSSGIRPQGWGRGGAGASNMAQDSAKTDKDKRPSRYMNVSLSIDGAERNEGGREGERKRESTITLIAYIHITNIPVVQNVQTKTGFLSVMVLALALAPKEVTLSPLLTARQRKPLPSKQFSRWPLNNNS